MNNVKDRLRMREQELKERQNTIRVIGADPMSEKGFTQVPNFILTNPKLSVGAKLTYATLLKYAWAEDKAFPGQERLARDIGIGVRSVTRYLKELKDARFISIKQRGLGRVNLYKLNLRVQKHK